MPRRGRPRWAAPSTGPGTCWTPAEQDALAQCSVFRGGFTLEAAEAVLALPPFGPGVLEVVQSLRSKSLLRA